MRFRGIDVRFSLVRVAVFASCAAVLVPGVAFAASPAQNTYGGSLGQQQVNLQPGAGQDAPPPGSGQAGEQESGRQNVEEVAGEGSGRGSSPAGGGTDGADGESTGGGLPFTGLGIAAIAALGLGIAAIGVALRRVSGTQAA